MKKQLSPADKQQAVNDLSRGTPISVIARRYNVTEQSIYNWQKAMPPTVESTKPIPAKKATLATKKKAVAEYNAGSTTDVVAKKYGISHQTVLNWKAVLEGKTPAYKKAPTTPTKLAVTGTSNFVFKVDERWTPTKFRHISGFYKSILDYTKKLEPSQSFPVSIKDMVRYGGGNGKSPASTIRNLIKRELTASMAGRISVHEVRNADKVLESIRIRRADEA